MTPTAGGTLEIGGKEEERGGDLLLAQKGQGETKGDFFNAKWGAKNGGIMNETCRNEERKGTGF